MGFEIKGTVKFISAVQHVGKGEKQHAKRELWVEHGDMYPQVSSFEFFGKNEPKLEGVTVGQSVTVHYNLRGREYTGRDGDQRVFNSLDGWKIEAEGTGNGEAEANDDIPF